MTLFKLFSLLSVALITAILVAWFGLFNVSAKEKHWDITTALLVFVRERSIEVRAKDIQVPNNLSNPSMISNGAKNFDAMCTQCHLAPEMQATELHLGLYPQPPLFHTEPEEHGHNYGHKHEDHSKANTFWTIQNGLKLTGMPAWGDFHTDEQIWEMVAFLGVFNGMSAKEYRQLVGEGGHTHKEGFSHTTDSNKKTTEHDSIDSPAHKSEHQHSNNHDTHNH